MFDANALSLIDAVFAASETAGRPALPAAQESDCRALLARVLVNHAAVDAAGCRLDALVQEHRCNWVTAGSDQFRLPAVRLLTAGVDGLSDDEVAVLFFHLSAARRAHELLADANAAGELSAPWQQVVGSVGQDAVRFTTDFEMLR
jgi:hypothetical protein